MTCEETRYSLSLYVDDCVSLPARVAIDDHLDRCPVCRSEAAELRSLTRGLKMMTQPTPPPYLAESITDLLTIEAAARRQAPKPPLGIRIARFLEPRLMPYTVGSFASVIMFFLMFTALRPHFVALREAALQRGGVTIIDTGYDLRAAADLARKRFSDDRVSELSPTLDPNGRLAAMTRGYAHVHASYYSDIDDADDMTVIADVFSDGRGSLVDVVRAPRDKRMLEDFESALRQDRVFVKAEFDRRPDTMRVTISFGSTVEVDAQNF
ncbi:MAG TPA: zf-HC2 domain-containing protein [Pyrinomonadaceae bacterium]|nr:zf-HC2 domain-containing protein [Pyrinomonadaceae bacterium]